MSSETKLDWSKLAGQKLADALVCPGGVKAFNQFRTDNPGWIPDLRGAEFEIGANLKEINLSKAIMGGIDDFEMARAEMRVGMVNVDLTNADLTEAILPRAQLQGAKLKNTKLYRADLRRVGFNTADIASAKFDGAKCAGITILGVTIPAELSRKLITLMGARVVDDKRIK